MANQHPDGPWRFVASYKNQKRVQSLLVGPLCDDWGDAYDGLCDAMHELRDAYGLLPPMEFCFVGSIDATGDAIDAFAAGL